MQTALEEAQGRLCVYVGIYRYINDVGANHVSPWDGRSVPTSHSIKFIRTDILRGYPLKINKGYSLEA